MVLLNRIILAVNLTGFMLNMALDQYSYAALSFIGVVFGLINEATYARED